MKEEEDIRQLVAAWHRATAAGDVETILGLMAEDVVFLRAGQPPMKGKAAFAEGTRAALDKFRIESSADVQEVRTAGDLAYCWTELRVEMVPRGGGPGSRRAGPALTLLRKARDGKWVVSRDANMLAEI
ncbi:MAG TPA: SgcJ/EcaC family oxidoreductase [Vicinamibacteria bacterium]|nr:SgcJ/EcaC family oxidoreductase [Vicinamibacteria bacterium]